MPDGSVLGENSALLYGFNPFAPDSGALRMRTYKKHPGWGWPLPILGPPICEPSARSASQRFFFRPCSLPPASDLPTPFSRRTISHQSRVTCLPPTPLSPPVSPYPTIPLSPCSLFKASSTGVAMISRTRSRSAGTSSLTKPLVSMVSCRRTVILAGHSIQCPVR